MKSLLLSLCLLAPALVETPTVEQQLQQHQRWTPVRNFICNLGTRTCLGVHGLLGGFFGPIEQQK